METEDCMEERLMAGIRLLVPIIMYGLTFAGVTLDADLVYCALLGVAGIASTVWAWWKNNNVTEAAQTAQQFLDAIKAGYTVEETLQAFQDELAEAAEDADK